MTKAFVFLLFWLLPLQLIAEPLRVAVASNFSQAMDEIVARFEQQSGQQVELIYGSTGKIYAQIINGAPFDAFFAADRDRPERLEREGRIQAGSRFSYAVGRLVLWSPDAGLIDNNAAVLSQGGFRHLAIANPKLAPYGKAAQQVLQARGVWTDLQNKIVRGENIGQAFQFVISANAELGFVALSQLQSLPARQQGSHWLVPASLHDPIEQQAVQLSDRSAVTALMDFVKTATAKQIIRDYGYGSP